MQLGRIKTERCVKTVKMGKTEVVRAMKIAANEMHDPQWNQCGYDRDIQLVLPLICSCEQVNHWIKASTKSTKVETLSIRLKSSKNHNQVDAIHRNVLDDRHLTVQQMSKMS